jgi:HK97 family phage major capsid protein
MNLQELRDEKGTLANQAQQILDAASADGRKDLKADEEARFDAIHADIEKLTKTIGRLEKQAALDAPDQRRSNPVDPNQSQTRARVTGKPSIEDRALAFHGWMASCMPGASQLVSTRHKEAAERCGVSLASGEFTFRLSPEPLSVRGGLVAGRTIREDDIRLWEQRLTQVSVVSPDLGGHYTVPDEMMRSLEVALLEFGNVRGVSTVHRTTTGAALPIPTLNDTSNKGVIITEGSDLQEEDVQFDQLVLDAFKFSSKRVPVSWEYLQDNAINFTGRIGGILGERISRIQNEYYTTGDGSSKPRGVVTAAANSSVTTSGATTISHDNLVDLKHSVDPSYRRNGRFMFNDTTLKILKKIKVAQFSGDTGGWPLWRAGLSAGEPDTIDGDPYVINQDMASGNASKAIIYGDLSKYQVRDVQEITLLRLNERYAELGVVAFVAWARSDGDLLNAGTNPVKYLTMG